MLKGCLEEQDLTILRERIREGNMKSKKGISMQVHKKTGENVTGEGGFSMIYNRVLY